MARQVGGRPPIGRPIEFAIPAEMLDELDLYAALAGATRSDLIRTILRDGLDRLAQPKEDA